MTMTTAAHGYLQSLLDSAWQSWLHARRPALDEKEEWRQRWQLITAALIYSAQRSTWPAWRDPARHGRARRDTRRMEDYAKD